MENGNMMRPMRVHAQSSPCSEDATEDMEGADDMMDDPPGLDTARRERGCWNDDLRGLVGPGWKKCVDVGVCEGEGVVAVGDEVLDSFSRYSTHIFENDYGRPSQKIGWCCSNIETYLGFVRFAEFGDFGR